MWRQAKLGVGLALIGFGAYLFIGYLGIGEWARLLVWSPIMMGLYLIVTRADHG